MSKPSTAPPKPSSPKSDYSGPPATRVRAVKTGHNEYSVVEETFSDAPSSVKVLATKVDNTSAVYRCRLRLEEMLGPNRLGGTGLE